MDSNNLDKITKNNNQPSGQAYGPVDNKQATINIVKNQIDNIYESIGKTVDNKADGNTSNKTSSTDSKPINKNKYSIILDKEKKIEKYIPNNTQPNSQYINRIKQDEEDLSKDDKIKAWNKYHTAWQNYYQKYYENYYVSELNKAKNNIPASQPFEQPSQDSSNIDNLNKKIKFQIQTTAGKIKKSKHFWPIIAAICVMLIVFIFQYSVVIVANIKSYISPGYITGDDLVINPTDDITISSDPKLIIPKINVNVPIIFNISNTDKKAQMTAMNNGVIYFPVPGADSLPGEIGNAVLSGHSSNDVFASGDYKFIFAQLDRLTAGDTIYINYNSNRYTYTVTKQDVVLPTDVSKLVYTTDKPMLTLITCTPLGTAQKRLLITAEQISPDPSNAPKPNSNSASKSAIMPGNN